MGSNTSKRDSNIKHIDQTLNLTMHQNKKKIKQKVSTSKTFIHTSL